MPSFLYRHVASTWWCHQMETFSTLLAILRGIHRSPVNSPHKGQWHGALMFSLICTRINCWVNIREAGDLRRYRAHYDVIVMKTSQWVTTYGGPYFADNIFKCIFIMFQWSLFPWLYLICGWTLIRECPIIFDFTQILNDEPLIWRIQQCRRNC